MQNVLLRCPGHFNDYKIPVTQRKNYSYTKCIYFSKYLHIPTYIYLLNVIWKIKSVKVLSSYEQTQPSQN